MDVSSFAADAIVSLSPARSAGSIWLCCSTRVSWIVTTPSCREHEKPGAVLVFVMFFQCAKDQSGNGWPRVSMAHRSVIIPTMNIDAVSAIGMPSVPKWLTAIPRHRLTPAAKNRPIDVEKANAVARIEVGYCSGNHSAYMAALPPPNPMKNDSAMNGTSPD